MQQETFAVSETASAAFSRICGHLQSMSHLGRTPSKLTRVVVMHSSTTSTVGAIMIPMCAPDTAALVNAYRLSPTQARIAVLLAARLTNREIAEVMGCRYDTARKHVEMVMMRMLVHRREDILYRLQELVVEEGVRSPPRPIVASLDSAS